MSYQSTHTIEEWWQHIRPRLVVLYLFVAIVLLLIPSIEHARLLSAIGHPFGEFFSATDRKGLPYSVLLIDGLCWLLVGLILLVTSPNWIGGIESLTSLLIALLFFLYSDGGNSQRSFPSDSIFQLVWVPACAFLGAACLHLSVAYRSALIDTPRKPHLRVDGVPYLPVIAIVLFEWTSYRFMSGMPLYISLLISVGYVLFATVLSFCMNIRSFLSLFSFLLGKHPVGTTRHNPLAVWIGGIWFIFGIGLFPLLVIGQSVLPLHLVMFLAAIYPWFLLYAIRSVQHINHLHVIGVAHEQEIHEGRKAVQELHNENRELEHATSLLLQADAHLRSTISQRIHDQPKQQALRIRSLLGYWQHKLKVEAERDPSGKVQVQPITEALGKVRKASEDLEDDLRGLQLLVEDAYQRRSLGLKLHLEKLIHEDLPPLYPESPLKVQADLWALDALSHDLEKTAEGARIAEAISYTVTQALLNIYHHAGASFATVRTVRTNNHLEIYIIDNGRGFDISKISPEKTSLFKARLKAREAYGVLSIQSVSRPQPLHGTTILLRLSLPDLKKTNVLRSAPLLEPQVKDPHASRG